jgi:hypothetical protein
MEMETTKMLKLKPNTFTELCGWYGMSALIVAYALASFGIIQGNGIAYQVLNISGGIGLMIIAAAKNVVQSVLLNIFWIIIGLTAIINILF